MEELHLLNSISIRRCLKPPDFGEAITAQLHHFADASEKGYGAVTYLLLHNSHLQTHTSFIMGKSRVAPLKPVTIPRMELTAAVVAVCMDKLWSRELRLPLQDSVFWTDSTSVLKYINNKTSRFRVFVANRVSEIPEPPSGGMWIQDVTPPTLPLEVQELSHCYATMYGYLVPHFSDSQRVNGLLTQIA